MNSSRLTFVLSWSTNNFTETGSRELNQIKDMCTGQEELYRKGAIRIKESLLSTSQISWCEVMVVGDDDGMMPSSDEACIIITAIIIILQVLC